MTPSDERSHSLASLPPPFVECHEDRHNGSPSNTLLLDAPARPHSTPAPRHPSPPHAEQQREHGLWMILLGILAFLLASSVARNGEVWMHLARGKALVHGQYALGLAERVAPGVPAKPSWLYDLICYGLYATFGGTGLVLCKAFVVVALALVLFRLSRSGGERWLAAFCTALTILATSERLLLQPVTLSYLFLAVALFLLYENKATSAAGWRSFAPLVILFVIWANVDRWFVLGLGVAALLWLGQALDRAFGSEQTPGEVRRLLLQRGLDWVLLVAVCLLNPQFLGVFALPTELASLGLFGTSSDGLFEQVNSPFEKAYLAGRALTAAGLTYYFLLFLSLLSFVVNWNRCSWRRFLPWLGVTLLSILQVRTVPFFAVVVCPVLAWNARDFLVRQLESGQTRASAWQRAVIVGHALTLVLLLLMPVLAWPGWLQSPPFEPRRWTIETSPALQHGAEAVHTWMQQGKCDAQTRGLHLSAESIYAFTWFCPEAQAVRDLGLASALQSDRAEDPDTAARLRAAGIDYVVVYDTNRSRFLAAMGNLFHDPQQWSLLHLDGYLAIFGWRDPTQADSDPFRTRRLDLNRLAFRPKPEKRAPGKALEREPEVRSWWEAFWKPIPPRPVDQEEATLHLLQSRIQRQAAPQQHKFVWEISQSASFVGAAGGWNGPACLLDARQRLACIEPMMPSSERNYVALPVVDQIAHRLQLNFAQGRDDTSPAPLYLAVRAARRALAVNPDDAQAYLVLGQSYLRLLHNTRERVWGERWMDLVQLRQCQACTALNQAVLLKPNFAKAHYGLYQLYAELGYLDLTLEHFRAYVNLVQEAGPEPGEDAERFRERLTAHQQELAELTKTVENHEDKFLAASAGWKVGDRAMKALQEGLAGKARDLLLESDISAFGPQGMMMELELLLRTGQARKILDWVGPEQKTTLRASYHLLRIKAAAALGNYDLAREECNELSGSMAEATPGRESHSLRPILATMVASRVLIEQGGTKTVPDLIFQTAQRYIFHRRLAELAQALRKEADMTLLRGLLALEQGESEEAEIAFRQALSVWKDESSAARGEGLDFNARPVAQTALSWLEDTTEVSVRAKR